MEIEKKIEEKMEIEKRIFEKAFKKEIVLIEKEPLTSLDSITNQTSFNCPNIFRYEISFSDSGKVEFVGKWKSKKIIINGIKLLSAGDSRLFFLLLKNHKILGFNKSNTREIALYENASKTLKQYFIPVLATYQNNLLDRCFVALEEFKCGTDIDKINVYRVIDAITDIHAAYYQNRDAAKIFDLNNYSHKDYENSKQVLKKMFNTLDSENIQNYGEQKIQEINNFIDNIDIEHQKVGYRRTLTHNDFSNRNIFINDDALYIFDWELACFQNPEHDLIELLSSVIDKMSDGEIMAMIDYFKACLIAKTGVDITDKEYHKFLRFNMLEYCVNKLSVLRLVNRSFKLDFIETFNKNASRLMDLLEIGK